MRRWLTHLAPSFSSNTTPFFLSIQASIVKVNNLVLLQKLPSYSLSVSLLSFVVSSGPVTPITALTYGNVILNQRVCVQFFCLHVVLRVFHIGKGWDSGYISLAALNI